VLGVGSAEIGRRAKKSRPVFHRSLTEGTTAFQGLRRIIE